MNESMPQWPLFRPVFKKSKRRAEERDPDRLWLVDSDWYVEIGENGRHLMVFDSGKDDNDSIAGFCGPEILVNAPFLVLGETRERSRVVKAAGVVWKLVFDEIIKDPNFRYYLAGKSHSRKLEELIAGTYVVSGWDEVLLGPGSGDGGADVIARRTAKDGLPSFRILEDAKAYSPGKRVRHTDVRAMGFLATRDPSASKGIVTTTSSFQPGIYTDKFLEELIPNRLELRDGEKLVAWLREVHQANARSLSKLVRTPASDALVK